MGSNLAERSIYAPKARNGGTGGQLWLLKMRLICLPGKSLQFGTMVSEWREGCVCCLMHGRGTRFLETSILEKSHLKKWGSTQNPTKATKRSSWRGPSPTWILQCIYIFRQKTSVLVFVMLCFFKIFFAFTSISEQSIFFFYAVREYEKAKRVITERLSIKAL